MKLFSKIGLLIFTLSIVCTRSYISPSMSITHDGENHLARFANYKLAVKEGQFPPRLAPRLMNGYTYPVFNYNYPLANLLSLPFSALKISYELSFKLIVWLSLIFGGWGVVRLMGTFDRSRTAIVLGLCAYFLSYYLANLIVVRGNIGEILAYALFPWMIALVRAPPKSWLGSVLIISAWLLSHNILALYGSLILAVYAIGIHRFNPQSWKKIIPRAVCSLGLTAWFWLPAIGEVQLVDAGHSELVSAAATHLVTLPQILFGAPGLGFSRVGRVDDMSFAMGPFYLLIIILGGHYLLQNLWRQPKKKVIEKYWQQILVIFISLLVLIWIQTDLSLRFWQIFSGLNLLQFPWRLSFFLPFGVMILLIKLWPMIKSFSIKFGILLMLGWQLVQIFQFQPAGYFHHPNFEYDAFPQSSTTKYENRPLSFKYTQVGDWSPSVLIASGVGEATTVSWLGTFHQYQLNLSTDALLIEPTMNFAGWQTRANGELVQYQDSDEIQGRLAYSLPAGSYLVESKFTQQTPFRLIGNGVSLVSLLVVMMMVLRQSRTNWVNRFAKNNPLSLLALWLGALGLIGCWSRQVLPYSPSFPYAYDLLPSFGLPQWIYSWANFDGVHYLTIAQNGYFGTGLIQAFFPLYPLMIRLVDLVAHNLLVSGLLVSWASLVAVVLGWRELVKLLQPRLSPKQLNMGVITLLLFPTSFFLSSLYTESLFLALIIWSYVMMRRKKWWLAAILIGLASATRIIGVLFVLVLIIEIWAVVRQRQISYRRLGVLLLLASSGLLSYMYYLWQTFGDPLYFMHVQSLFGAGRQTNLVLYPQTLIRSIKIVITARPFDWKYLIYVQEFMAGTLGLGLIAYAAKHKFPLSLITYCALAFLVPTLTGSFLSMMRFILVIPAVSYGIFVFVQHSRWRQMWVYVLSAALLIINIVLFIQGYWVA